MTLDNASFLIIFCANYGGLNALAISLGSSFYRNFVVVRIHFSVSWVLVLCD